MSPDLTPTRLRTIVGSLIAATVVCTVFLGIRATLRGQVERTGFFGNLLLAWIPLLLSLFLCRELDRQGRRTGLLVTVGVLWILFFPNAAYIVTDLIHLKNVPPVPRWFDYILITAFGWTGLFLGYVSLALLQLRVHAWRGVTASWIFAISALAASSLGIYVGRFWRWNSWDVVAKPARIAGDITKLTNLSTLAEIAGFCAMFFALSTMVYAMLYALTRPLPKPAPAVKKTPAVDGGNDALTCAIAQEGQ